MTTPGIRIVQCGRAASRVLLENASSPAGVVYQMVHEVLREVPDADWIEIRAVRYDTSGEITSTEVKEEPA